MGDFTEHVLFGFLFAAVIAFMLKEWISLQPLEVFAASIVLFAGSVLPDIDHENSYVHRSVKSFLGILAGAFAFLVLPVPAHLRFALSISVLLLVYAMFSRMDMRHRGFTHSMVFATLVGSTGVIMSSLLLYSAIPGIALFIGIFSHLLLDREFKIS